MLSDLRLAARGLSRKPGFAAIAVGTLALGTGAGTAMFSVIDGVLLSALPYPNPQTLMQVETVNQYGQNVRVSFPDYEDLRDQNAVFAELASYADYETSAVVSGQGVRVHVAEVSPEFYRAFGAEPAVGRVFTSAEARSAAPVAVVSNAWWRDRFAGTGTAPAGQTIRIGENPYTVVGVMPQAFDFPTGTQVWVPRQLRAESRTGHNWSVVGRLRGGISPAQAQQDLSSIARRIRQVHGDGTDTTDAAVTPLLDRLVGSVRPALLLLLGGAAVLMLVACVNVAGLFLARALTRDREFALRMALGALPSRLMRIYLAESLLVAAAGAALGILIAVIGVPVLVGLDPGWLPRVRDVSVNWFVLSVALATCVLVAVMIALVPGIRAARRSTRGVMAGGQRVHGDESAGIRLRGALVVAQIALTVVVLIGAGLLGRTVLQLLSVDPGFRTEGGVVAGIWLPYPDSERPEPGNVRIADFIQRYTARLRAEPGVEAAGGVNSFPLRGSGATGTYVVVQEPDEISNFDEFLALARDPSRAGYAAFRIADTDYFEVMNIPLIRGRSFDSRDVAQAPHVAVISESLAQTRWPDEEALGQQIFFGNMDGDLRSFTVIGVVGDVRENGLGFPPQPTLYADVRQRPRSAAEFHIAVRGSIGDSELIATARRIAAEIDPQVPVEFRSLEQIVSASVAERQFVLVLLTVFGALALLLAAAGVYSVMAFAALQRMSEMGVRMALGAHGGDVVRLLMRQGAKLATAGIVAGLLGAAGLAQVIGGLLYEVAPLDVATFAIVALVALAAALVASGIPAWRASQVSPVEALRHD